MFQKKSKAVIDHTLIDGVEKDLELCDGCKINIAEYFDQFPMYNYLKGGCKGPLPIVAVPLGQPKKRRMRKVSESSSRDPNKIQ